MEDDDFDMALAELEIPEMSNLPKSNSETSMGKGKSEASRNLEKEKAELEKKAEDRAGEKPKIVHSSNAIIVNSKQRGNPILKSINNIPYEFDDSIIPDYVVGNTACVLYLSLRYHTLKPDYIHEKLKQLGRSFELRVLLVQVDITDPHSALKHLTRICLLANLTLMLAWTQEEAGKIIETYKMFENKPPDSIMDRNSDSDVHQKLVSALTNIKPVNKTDAMSLLTNFGTLENVITTSQEKLSLISGLGPRKAQKLVKTFNEPFLK